jgi:predicted DNA-binding transcriptional regulator YafY
VPVAAAAPGPPSDPLLDAAVRAIRGGDKHQLAGSLSTGRPTADVLAMLVQAAGSGEALWIGYVDAEGRATQRVVEPVAVEGGYLNAYDHLRGAVRSFAVHRITGVSPLDDDAVS